MAADGGGVIFGGQPLTQWEKGSRAHSRWWLMVGCDFWWATADPVGKRIAGSSKMASGGGGVIFGGQPLTQWGQGSRAQQQLDDIKRDLMV